MCDGRVGAGGKWTLSQTQSRQVAKTFFSWAALLLLPTVGAKPTLYPSAQVVRRFGGGRKVKEQRRVSAGEGLESVEK